MQYHVTYVAVGTLLCLLAGIQGAPDNRGTEFVIGYMANYELRHPVELYVTTSITRNVDVHVSAPRFNSKSFNLDTRFTVTAGKVHQIKISNKIRAANTEMSTKGILVTASDEVVVYGTNLEVYSNDAFLGFPTDVLGMEYYTVSHHPSTLQCEFMIIGVEDGTSVRVELGKHSSIEVKYNGKRYYENKIISLKMNRFDTFQAQTYGDLTGSYITSDKKITVMSGNRRTSVKPGSSRDTLVDQMLPVDVWGKKFAIVPTPERTTGDNVRFIGSVDNTQVKVTCSGGWKSSFRVNRRSYVLKITPSNQNCYVEATEGIMVILIVVSQTRTSEPADPALITIPPIEQYGADYTFSTPKYSKGEYKNFFMFIVDAALISGLKLNGAAISAQKVRSIPGTNYVGGYIIVTPGTHTVRHDSPISVFGGFMYGTARYETYGMPLGMRMAPVNTICIPTPTVVGDGLDNDCDGLIDEEMCTPENKGKDDDGDGVAEEDCATPLPINGGWTAWTGYTACSASCTQSTYSTGTKTRTRTCTNPAPKYNGVQCAGGAAETVKCSTTTKCAVDGGWGSWTNWASCSVTCASGTWSRRRSCDSPAPLSGGAQCSGSATQSGTCNTGVNCPVAGGYGSWSSWGSCTVSCGGGTKSASRSCDSPAPAYGGASCVGSGSKSTSCNTQNCPIDGTWATWGAWGSCSVTCSTGRRERTRTCTPPLYGGNDCVGNTVGSGTCDAGSCPIDGGYGDWSLWTSCTVTCGGGTKGRTRSCSNPAPQYGGASCAGSASDSVSCGSISCPIDGQWADWGAWSSCPVTCGSGPITRSRTCSNPAPQHNGADCVGNDVEASYCSSGNCPIDGGYSDWSLWTTCTVTCGGGTTGRLRSCDNPTPAHGGSSCSGSASEALACGTISCPIDGGWSNWNAWSSCPVTCSTGTVSRSRTCTNPSPQHNGADCVGNTDETTTCNAGPCPIDGGYSDWSLWTTCTVTCGGGTSGRARTCDNPTAQYGGASCAGSATESLACGTINCPIDGDWSVWTAWSACGITCGYSTHSRSRTCDNPTPQYNGADCAGSASESQQCYAGIMCPIDGGLTDWTAWDTCTVTCAGGTQGRTRTCTNPTPQYNGAACTGSTSESQACNTQNCPIDGDWTSWDSWSGCSSTCGPGAITRDRTCTNPLPQYGGAGCFGDPQESIWCNGTCTVHGNWGDWGQWTDCTQTCDSGRQGRVRLCNDPAPTPDGNPCIGNAFEIEVCAEFDCSSSLANGTNGQYVNRCPNGFFTCQSGKITCIREEFKCDCTGDCYDNSDEKLTWASCPTDLVQMCESSAIAVSYSFAFIIACALLAIWGQS